MNPRGIRKRRGASSGLRSGLLPYVQQPFSLQVAADTAASFRRNDPRVCEAPRTQVTHAPVQLSNRRLEGSSRWAMIRTDKEPLLSCFL